MSVDHGRLMLMLLYLTGAFCDTYKVEFQQPICAVKGSSVIVLCSFYHPDNLKVRRVMWSHVRRRHPKARVIFDSNLRKVATGFQYIGDKRHSCTLKIHQVTKGDAGKYIITLNNRVKAGNAGPGLKVVDLKVLVTKTNGKETVKEGDSVNLTCVNGCDAHDPSPAFNWFKDGKAMNEGRVLSLSNISSANSGNYSCSLKTQAGATSGVVNIDVEYGPVNTTVSFRPPAGLDADSNLTLICSSRSNPPVQNYTWFKVGDDVVEVGHQPVYIPGDRGQYLCSAANKHGSQNSSTVTLQVRSHWAAFNRDVLITAAVALLLIVTTVIAVTGLQKPRTWASKTDCHTQVVLIAGNSVSQDADNCNIDRLQEKTQPVGGTPEVYATLNFNSTRKSNTRQQMDRGEDVIYSTVHQ